MTWENIMQGLTIEMMALFGFVILAYLVKGYINGRTTN